MTQATHIYHFNGGSDPTGTPLVLLHGSGGHAHDFLPLADALAPGSPVLGIQGNVAIDGGFAFFRRFPDRTIDEADLASRVPVLADFIEASARRYDLAKAAIAVG